MIDYQLEPNLAADEFIDVLRRSTLAERRPVDDRNRIARMLANADIVATVRHDRQLVGVARGISDYSYCTYLADLAVDERFQRQGIGKELLHRLHAAARHDTMLILLAAPKAVHYYPHIGLVAHNSCWVIPRK